MIYVLDNVSRSNLILFLIVILLVFIAITIIYLIHLQIRANNQYKINTSRTPSVPLYKEEVNKQMVKEEEPFDLQSITRELETVPRERTIEMTPYEEEQEQKAIISYDELVNHSYQDYISYSDTTNSDDILVKQVDLENTGKIKLEKKDNNLINYEHEEEFLKELKELNELLN